MVGFIKEGAALQVSMQTLEIENRQTPRLPLRPKPGDSSVKQNSGPFLPITPWRPTRQDETQKIELGERALEAAELGAGRSRLRPNLGVRSAPRRVLPLAGLAD